MGSTFKIILLFLIFTITSCTNLLYWPDRYLHADPTAFGINFKEYYVRSYDGTRLLAWELKSTTQPAENLVLMFHGNAENLSSHAFNLAWMTEKKSDVIVFDYRGYGLSEGTPYPRGLVEDGLRFLQLAYDKFKEGNYKHFIIYTQSLGGDVAMRALEEVAWKDEVSLLVLDSTFRSPQEVAKAKTKLFWWLMSGGQTADKKLSHLTMPVLVVHAVRDPIVPFQFGQELYDTIPSKNKTFWKLEEPEAFHGNIFFIKKGQYREDFLKLISANGQPPTGMADR